MCTEQIAALKKELGVSWDHLDLNCILPSEECGDQETKSTTTASEIPDIDNIERIPAGNYSDGTAAAVTFNNLDSKYNHLQMGISTVVVGSNNSGLICSTDVVSNNITLNSKNNQEAPSQISCPDICINQENTLQALQFRQVSSQAYPIIAYTPQHSPQSPNSPLTGFVPQNIATPYLLKPIKHSNVLSGQPLNLSRDSHDLSKSQIIIKNAINLSGKQSTESIASSNLITNMSTSLQQNIILSNKQSVSNQTFGVIANTRPILQYQSENHAITSNVWNPIDSSLHPNTNIMSPAISNQLCSSSNLLHSSSTNNCLNQKFSSQEMSKNSFGTARTLPFSDTNQPQGYELNSSAQPFR